MLRIALAFVALLAAAPLRAQVAIVDEGTFTHSIAGSRVGREDFSVRTVRGGGSMNLVAQANVLAGEQRRKPAHGGFDFGKLWHGNPVLGQRTGRPSRTIAKGCPSVTAPLKGKAVLRQDEDERSFCERTCRNRILRI